MSSAGNRAANSSELSLEGYSESMLPEQSSPPQSLRLSVGNLKCRYPHINLIKVCFCYFWFLCFFFFFFFKKQTENKCMNTKKGKWRWVNWEIGTDIYILLRIK